MSDTLEIIPVCRPVVGTIRPPGSKSLTNRALILAALAQGPSRLTGVLDSVDTQVMIESLRRLGLSIDQDLSAKSISLVGCGGQISTHGADLYLENSGTSIRFLTAMCCIGEGRFRLDGNARMRERPIAPLVKALSEASVDIRCELQTDCPPVVIEAKGLPGGEWAVDGNLSSQYLSALLMTAPCAQSDVTLRVRGELVSRPYVDMTIANMKQFGAQVTEPQPNVFQITARPYQGCDYDIEPDASAASYFFALAAVTGGDVTVQGLTREALQGDVEFVDALVRMGCEAEYGPQSIRVIGRPLQGHRHRHERDQRHCPDLGVCCSLRRWAHADSQCGSHAVEGNRPCHGSRDGTETVRVGCGRASRWDDDPSRSPETRNSRDV